MYTTTTIHPNCHSGFENGTREKKIKFNNKKYVRKSTLIHPLPYGNKYGVMETQFETHLFFISSFVIRAQLVLNQLQLGR